MSDAQMRPLGAQISHMLKARGVDVIFGIPGVHNQEMYRGIEEAGITHVLARHEQGAGFMADGYARATGKPGVAYVITGPGLCNIMTPMGQAYSDSVPMLVISSCLNRADLGISRGRLHEMKDQEGAAATVCDWSRTAMDAASAYQLIDRALYELATQRPRPKHIQVPIEVLEAMAPPAPPFTPPATAHGAPDEEVLKPLLEARKPLFVFGGGTKHCASAARAAMDALGAACFTSYAGRGVIRADHGLNFGANLARPDSAAVFAEADLVIAVGTEFSECDLWRDHPGHTCPLVRVDIDALELADLPADTLIRAEAEAFLTALTTLAEGQKDSDWNAAHVAEARARWRSETDSERPGIARICESLSSVMPENAMYYSDMTQFAYVAKEIWDMPRPAHWHHPFGFGTLGYALPSAIGGAMARPNLPTIAIAGDYGFQYTVQELGAAVEMKLPLVILLWDNGKLKEIEDSMTRAQIAPNSVIAHNPDFVKLAEAYGASAHHPASLEALQDTVLAAFDADGPTLIYMTPALTA